MSASDPPGIAQGQLPPPRWGRGLTQLVPSLPTMHLRGRKGFIPSSLEKLGKAGFFSRPNFLNMAVRCIVGKGKMFLQLPALRLTPLNPLFLQNHGFLAGLTGHTVRPAEQLLGNRTEELGLLFTPVLSVLF